MKIRLMTNDWEELEEAGENILESICPLLG